MEETVPEKAGQSHVPIEETPVFQNFEKIAYRIWVLVDAWESYPKWTLGKQLTEAADSVGFNLVEGDGRYSDSEAIHFFYIARGSARETKLGIARSLERRLIDDKNAKEITAGLNQGILELNRLIGYRKRTRNVHAVREPGLEYASNISGEEADVNEAD